MQINDRLHGFCVKSIREAAEVAGVLYELEYEKNGAKLLWLSRDDDNKTFSVTFKTIPEDDTGVFHILEHSVLGGSEKYPVKEPFVELLKGSMQTFLNAFTFPDKTMYPVCSRNSKDFLNLIDVYLDAVFHPTIYTKPETFWQEGWHYELFSPEDPLTRNGVVYNEMQGAYSSVENVIHSKLNRLLYPDNCYRFESGGDPASIPELTYEQFLESHKRFYHPSNAMFFLDGNIDIYSVLALIHSVLAPYEKAYIDTDIPMQSPVPYGETTCRYEIGEDEDADNKVQFAIGYVFADFSQQEKSLAMDILVDALCGTNEAPLKKAIISKGLAEDVYFSTVGTQHIEAYLVVRNTSEEKLDELKQTIRETYQNIVNNGFDKELLTACLNNLEFVVKERDYGSMPRGLGFAMSIFDTWLYGGDPMQNLSYNESFDNLRKKIDSRFFEELLEESILNSQHCAAVSLLPSKTLGNERREKETRDLQLIKDSWTDATISSIIGMNERLKKAQEEPDSIEDLQKLPSLSLSDISEEPEKLPIIEKNIDGNIVLLHEVETGGITYADIHFSAADLSLEELSKLALLCELLTQTPTENMTALQLLNDIKSNLGFLSATPSLFSKPGQTSSCNPYITIGCGFLENKEDDALRLIYEVIAASVFTDRNLIKNIIAQRKLAIERAFSSSGSAYAVRRIASSSSAHGAASGALSGLEFYRNLVNIEKNFVEKPESVCEELLSLCKRLFVKSRAVVSITGMWKEKLAQRILNILPDDSHNTASVPESASYIPAEVKREGIVTPCSVSFAAKGANLYNIGAEYSGCLRVAASLLSLGYLWNTIRVQGGAYGTGLSVNINGAICFSSYRDPDAANSLDCYDSAGNALREFCASDEELTKYIIGTIADTEPVLSPKLKGRNSAAMFLSGINYETRLKTRREILSATKEKLLEVSYVLDNVCSVNNVCVVGEKSKVEACGSRLDTITTIK